MPQVTSTKMSSAWAASGWERRFCVFMIPVSLLLLLAHDHLGRLHALCIGFASQDGPGADPRNLDQFAVGGVAGAHAIERVALHVPLVDLELERIAIGQPLVRAEQHVRLRFAPVPNLPAERA